MASVPATKTTDTTLVASAVPDFVQGDIDEFAGVGNSSDSSDSIVPYLVILQKGSPAVNEHEDAYVSGAKPGMLMNTATKTIYDKVRVVPCGFEKAYIEWKPRSAGGGFVARHAFSPAVAEKLGAQKNDRGGLVLPNGNELVETAYTFCLLSDNKMPVVVASTSSQLKPTRAWMSLRKNKRSPNGRELPSFSSEYEIGTVWQKNDKGDWFNFVFTDGGFVTDAALYETAKAFARATMSGETKVAQPEQAHDTEDAPF